MPLWKASLEQHPAHRLDLLQLQKRKYVPVFQAGGSSWEKAQSYKQPSKEEIPQQCCCETHPPAPSISHRILAAHSSYYNLWILLKFCSSEQEVRDGWFLTPFRQHAGRVKKTALQQRQWWNQHCVQVSSSLLRLNKNKKPHSLSLTHTPLNGLITNLCIMLAQGLWQSPLYHSRFSVCSGP